MPLYSNTTTGNNQVTHTASEQVTKVLPYDTALLVTHWTSYPELSIPLGPHQRVIGTANIWYNSQDTPDLYVRAKLSDPNDIHANLDPANNNYKAGSTVYNLSAATKIEANNDENNLRAADDEDHALLNLTMVDTDTTDLPKWVEIDTSADNLGGTGNKYLRISFKVISTDNTPSDFRFQFSRNSGNTYIESGSNITYTKY